MTIEEPSINLHDIWALTAIDGEEIDTNQFKQGVPTMELYVEDLKINGFSGCNNYFGEINELSEESLVFGPIAATKKMCIGVDESAFLLRLNEVERYEIGKMILSLYTADNRSLSFKKVD